MKKIFLLCAAVLLLVAPLLAAPTIGTITKNSDPVAKFTKFELTFSLATTATNLYDPAQIDVRTVFTNASGDSVTITAFPYQGYTRSGNFNSQTLTPSGSLVWKCRFSPPSTGQWSYRVYATDNTGTSSSTTGSPFNVSDSTRKGFVEVSPVDPHYFRFSDGTAFFPIGENMTWDNNDKGNNTYVYDNYLGKLAAQGGNMIRLWMCSWAFGVEWSDTGLGNYANRQNRAWCLDYVFEKLDSMGMVAELCLINHGQYNGDEFGSNPYNAANGGPLVTADAFWSDATAQTYMTRRWRYITARWGYATSLMNYEFFNEIENTTNYSGHIYTDIPTWHTNNADIIRSMNAQKHPISTSWQGYITGQDASWANLDFTQFHNYNAQDMAVMMEQRVPQYRGYKNVAVIAGEYGSEWDWNKLTEMVNNDPTAWHMHNAQWAALMCGAAGGGLNWWWDLAVDPQNWYFRFKGISEFVKNEDLDQRGYVPLKVTPGNPNGAPLRCYYIRGNNRVLGWIQNSNSAWYARSQNWGIGTSPAPTITLTGLSADGTWTIEWWDTVLGTVTGTSTVNVVGGAVTLTSPQIDSGHPDRAFKLYRSSVVQSTWRVNCGGTQYIDVSGYTWAADTNYVGGGTASTTNTITNTTDPVLDQTERWGNPFSYIFNVPAGNYQVLLKFAESTFNANGARVFNVSINGSAALSNFDIYQSAPEANRAIERVFENIAPNAQGQIIIQFGPASADAAKIDAIQVLAAATMTPTRTSTPTPTPTQIVSGVPGTIQCEDYMNGGEGTGYHDNVAGNIFSQYRTDDVDIEVCTDAGGGYSIGSVTAGEWLAYRVNASAGVYDISFRVGYLGAGGNFHLEIDGVDVTGAMSVPDTGGWQNWATISKTGVAIASGLHTLRLVMDTNGPASGGTGNFNWIQLSAQPTATPTASATRTATATATNTPTASVTNSATATRTFTPTSTDTFTASVTPTFTFTYSPTNTPSNTATNTATASYTATGTPTETVTGTQPPTWTPTNTPSFTQTFTATGTMTETATATASSTHAFSATHTPTDTQTLTVTVTFTPSLTATPSVSPTNAVSTATNTETATMTPTATGTPSFTTTPTHSFTATATPTRTATNAFTPTATPTATVPQETKVISIIYPNPARGKVKLALNGCAVMVKIFTVSFRKIYTYEYVNPACPQGFEAEVDISLFSRGIYHVVAENEKGQRMVKELVVY